METKGRRPISSASIASCSTILLVEDEVVVRQITAQVLESAGYTVLEASSPREALHLAGTYAGDIHLLLSDVVMPEMNGVELADRMRRVRPNLATIFMSGYATSDILKKVMSGSAMHIQKPFTVSVLLSHVAYALQANMSAEDPRGAAAGNLQTTGSDSRPAPTAG